MKPLTPLCLLVFACLASSCNERQSHKDKAAAAGSAASVKPASGYCLPASSMWAEEEYTQWMTRAELQYFHDQTPADQHFAHIEGRNNGGLNEYRAVKKPLPTEQYAKGAAFWGLTDKELYDCELRLLRSGLVRKSMQAFVDASGTALYQLVWLKPVGVAAAAADKTPPVQAPVPPESAPATATADGGQSHPVPATHAKPSTAANFIPVEEKTPAAVVAPTSEAQAGPDAEPSTPQKFTTYTVVKGDIMEKIARRHHTTVEAIKAANNLSNDSLTIGQKLKIPKK
ncbi:MAG: LysM peptidoglycan-binding domain-containing protein [Verrucomicrobiota bacterium]